MIYLFINGLGAHNRTIQFTVVNKFKQYNIIIKVPKQTIESIKLTNGLIIV